MNTIIIKPFKSWWSFILTNLFCGFLFSLFFIDKFQLSYLIIGTIWGGSIFITQWLGHVLIQIKIEKKYDWLTKPKQRFIWTFISIILYSTFAYGAIQIIMNLIVNGRIPNYIFHFNTFWLLPILISFVISSIMAALGFFKNWKNAIIKQEQLKTEVLNYKYESLRNQINPHFMFNSLNVLSELIYEDTQKAELFIQKFSSIYRYVLESREKELIDLSHEITFIENYISLLKYRFGNKLNFELDWNRKTSYFIVPMTLQLLIENAVKHTVISKEHPLQITLKLEKDYFVVSNPIKLKTTNGVSDKIGLNNINQQYIYFTDKPVIIEENEDTFVVKIPLIKKLIK